jgi:hypothetical protein
MITHLLDEAEVKAILTKEFNDKSFGIGAIRDGSINFQLTWTVEEVEATIVRRYNANSPHDPVNMVELVQGGSGLEAKVWWDKVKNGSIHLSWWQRVKNFFTLKPKAVVTAEKTNALFSAPPVVEPPYSEFQHVGARRNPLMMADAPVLVP